MADDWVQATRDFGYDEHLGEVRLGQVFQLAGHVNDAGLIRHNLVIVLDPQPKKAALDKLVVCSECGRRFAEDWQRDRCGNMDVRTPADVQRDRRERAHQRFEERVIKVGA
jgi:hypothetical protein